MAIDYGEVISGAARSENINQDGLVIDMEAQSHLLEQNSYPFETLTRKINKIETTTRMKHEWREDRLMPNYMTMSAAAVAGATTLTINDYNRIKIDNILFVPSTGERLLVQTAPTTSTVTVGTLAGAGAGIVNAIANGAVILNVGEAHAEGEEVPAAFSNEPISKYVYVMQSDRRVQVTDIEESEKHYGDEKAQMRNRRKAFIAYKRDQNLLGYVGQSSREVTSASGPRRHVCSGLIEMCTENPIDLSDSGGKLSLATLSAIMGTVTLLNDSGPKIGILGANANTQISAWPVAVLRTVNGADQTYGITVNEILTGFGSLKVMYDPTLNAKYGLADRAFVLDIQRIKQLQLEGLPVKYFMAIPNLSNIHNKVDAISGTLGYMLSLPELHSAIEGIG